MVVDRGVGPRGIRMSIPVVHSTGVVFSHAVEIPLRVKEFALSFDH